MLYDSKPRRASGFYLSVQDQRNHSSLDFAFIQMRNFFRDLIFETTPDGDI